MISVLVAEDFPIVREVTLARGTGGGEDALRQKLTATEQEVLRMLPQGLTDREIAQRLFVSPRTVQNHLARVREKTNTRRRSERALGRRARRRLTPAA